MGGSDGAATDADNAAAQFDPQQTNYAVKSSFQPVAYTPDYQFVTESGC